jgi:hypothetical protein
MIALTGFRFGIPLAGSAGLGARQPGPATPDALYCCT